MPLITFGTQVCGGRNAGSRREWLLSNGLGGYAMGTVSGLRTRRYHGLLTIAETPARRHLALASLDVMVVLPSGTRVPLGVHEWASGAVAPEGHRLLERFDLIDGLPRWRWRRRRRPGAGGRAGPRLRRRGRGVAPARRPRL